MLCRHLIQWWFGSSLLGFAPINKHVNLMNISLSLFSPRFDTLDWAKRQTIQKEIHFRLKPNFPLCSKGKDARLFRTNFLLITIEKKRCETQSSSLVFFYHQRLPRSFPSRIHFSTQEMRSSRTYEYGRWLSWNMTTTLKYLLYSTNTLKQAEMLMGKPEGRRTDISPFSGTSLLVFLLSRNW